MFGLQLAAYVTALWLACYLLARRPLSRPLVFAGFGLLAYAAALGLELLRESHTGPDGPIWLEPAHTILLVLPALCWTAALAFLMQRGIPLGRARDVAILTTLFFGLGCGLLLFRVPLVPRPLLILAIGADLLVFGWVVAALDAFDAGERLRPDFARSVASAALLVALFGGQVALAFALAVGAGPRDALTRLLLGVLAAAIAVPAFWSHLQRVLDSAVFGLQSPVGERRAALLSVADALPRQPAETNPLLLTDDELVAATRRALSSLGDLPKLAASPLTRLPIVDRRLAQRGATGDLLERAAELRLILAESVTRLKPAGDAPFGTTDAWRHYNALYFPYVAGLKPYGRRSAAEAPRDPALSAAAEWFRSSVPERTLHNWQRAAARLVALDLRERSLSDGSRGPELAAHGSTVSGGGSG